MSDDLAKQGRTVGRDLNNGFSVTCERCLIIEQMADRIEELEAKLAAKEKLKLALAGDKIDLVSELAGVKGKLEKVTEELEEYKWMYEDLCK